MELSTKERIVLNMIMEPQAGRYDTLKIVRKLREDLSFSEEEIKECGLQARDDGGLSWTKTIDKEVAIGEVAMGIIKKQFEKLDKEGKLHETHLDIYEKFVPQLSFENKE